MDKSALISFDMIGVGTVAIATPYCEIYALMIGIKFIGGIFSVVVNSSESRMMTCLI